MGIARKSRAPNQPVRALAARSRTASHGEAARTAVSAALDDLVETGLATWHERWENASNCAESAARLGCSPTLA